MISIGSGDSWGKDAVPPETPDECPVCGVDVSVDLTVFCSVSCQVVALNRLDKAEAALEVALGKMHTIASQYEVLYYDPDAGHYMIQTTENSRHHQHEDLLRPRIQLDGRKRLAEGIEHLEDVLGVEPPEELVRESGGGE